jgi:thymidylate synthase (FAD)
VSNVNIDVFPIAKTMVDRAEVAKWLERIGADEYEVPDASVASDPALLVALAAKRCYMSFQPGLNPNVTKVRRDMVEYIDNILASGHGSVLEHSVFTFAIEGVSRVFTAEMNRHRAGWAISEGSMRFIRFDKDIPWWMPKSLLTESEDNADLERRKCLSRAVFAEVFNFVQRKYAELLDIWDMPEGSHNFKYKKRVTSCLRRIVPMGVATGGVWTGNVRALRHVLTMRGHEPSAEEEIFHVFGEKIAPLMIGAEPLLFGDFAFDADGSCVPEYRKV